MAEDSNAACRAQNSSQHPDPLRPSELFGLTWDSYQGKRVRDRQYGVAWPAATQEDQAQKSFRRPTFAWSRFPRRWAGPIEQWRAQCLGAPDALMFPNPGPRAGHVRHPNVSRQLAAP